MILMLSIEDNDFLQFSFLILAICCMHASILFCFRFIKLFGLSCGRD